MLPFQALFVPFLLIASLFGPGWLGTYLSEDDSGRIVVTEVIAGSPAQKAGVQNGDVIAALDGKSTTSVEALIEAIRGKQAGDKVKLTLARPSGEVVVEVTLGERPADSQAGARVPPPVRVEQGGEVKVEKATDKSKTGAAAGPETKPQSRPSEADPTGKPYLGLALEETEQGVSISEVLADGPAGKAKVATGLLVGLNGKPIKTLAEMDKVMAGIKPGDTLVLTVHGKESKDYKVIAGSIPGPLRSYKAPAQDPRAVAEKARAEAEKARAEAEKARAEAEKARAARADAERGEAKAREQARAAEVRAAEAKPEAGDDPRAQLKAGRGKRPLALVFGASWDASTKALRKSLADDKVKAALGDRQVLWFDTDRFGPVADEFKVQQIPHIVLLDASGKTEQTIEGFQPAEALAGMLSRGAKAAAAKPVEQPVRTRARVVETVPEAAPPRAARGAEERSAERDLEKEIRELRNEIRELRQTLRELLNERRR